MKNGRSTRRKVKSHRIGNKDDSRAEKLRTYKGIRNVQNKREKAGRSKNEDMGG